MKIRSEAKEEILKVLDTISSGAPRDAALHMILYYVVGLLENPHPEWFEPESKVQVACDRCTHGLCGCDCPSNPAGSV